MKRLERLMPNGTPRYLRIWDNKGETIDRYTVAFTGRGNGGRWGIAMNEAPRHPQGFCQHWEANAPLTSKMGKRIKFADLPLECQDVVLIEYLETWGIRPTSGRA
jgi:hypothetical protein